MPKKTDPFMPQESKQGKTKSESSKQDSCCSSGNPCATTSSAPKSFTAIGSNLPTSQKGSKTRIIIKYDVGFKNSLYLRGNGTSLNWEKGIPLKNVKNDEWVWESDQPFTSLEFKVLINDKQYEQGDNHRVLCGGTIQYTPKF